MFEPCEFETFYEDLGRKMLKVVLYQLLLVIVIQVTAYVEKMGIMGIPSLNYSY